MVDQTQP